MARHKKDKVMIAKAKEVIACWKRVSSINDEDAKRLRVLINELEAAVNEVTGER